MAFPPVLNGLDYLDSVVSHLSDDEEPDSRDSRPTPRDLKYAVLHLQAATEVLLKARLQQEHWTLVVKDPGRASHQKFTSGDFLSCGIDETLERLRNIVGLELNAQQLEAVRKLGKTRNALQHYGLSQSAHAVEAQAAAVLDFLLTFINVHLRPHVPPAEQALVDAAMEGIRHRLHTITRLIATRMTGLRETLDACAETTVHCPECGMAALVAGAPISCRFCYRQWPDGEAAAEDYVWATMVRNVTQDPHDNETPPIRWCPACSAPALVEATCPLTEAPEYAIHLCLGCAAVFDRLAYCHCGGLLDNRFDEPIDFCLDCAKRMATKC
ncbi:hypothetical protein ACIP4X_29650 [Streptomyces sp. NPDC088817]|uniref:hypothetical protein n=1 Tax=unclassified Streptomyces TaxID=2593676 RepID=UPI0036E3DF6C